MRRALVALLLLTLAGCARPTHDEATLRRIAAESAMLLQTTAAGEVAPAKWPATIKSLEPREIIATPYGLYVEMNVHFDAESGYFFSRDEKKHPPISGPDFAYSPLGHGIYWYDAS